MTESAKSGPRRRLDPLPAWAAGFLLVGAVLVWAGATMYGNRNSCHLQLEPCADISSSTTLERSLFAAAVIATVIGLKLVAELTRGTSGLGATLSGANLYMFGGFLIVTTEMAKISHTTYPDSMIVAYMVLAALGQAILGFGLTRGIRGLKWVGWATVVWNLGFLVMMLLTSDPVSLYIPLVHHVMPTQWADVTGR
jgi:hypothetical protein